MPTSIIPGNIPNLVKQGFTGNVWCTAATRNLSVYMLLDSGHIQESDIEYLNKRRKRESLPPVEPLYTQADAQEALTHFVSVGLHRTITVADGVKATFHNAGHILGSAWVALDIKEFATGKQWRLIFSGDVGRKGMAILNDPELPGRRGHLDHGEHLRRRGCTRPGTRRCGNFATSCETRCAAGARSSSLRLRWAARRRSSTR